MAPERSYDHKGDDDEDEYDARKDDSEDEDEEDESWEESIISKLVDFYYDDDDFAETLERWAFEHCAEFAEGTNHSVNAANVDPSP